jgi:hypothetical protein
MREIRTRVIGEDELAMRPVLHLDRFNEELVSYGAAHREVSLACGFCDTVLVASVDLPEAGTDAQLYQVAFKCPNCSAHSVLPDE